MEQHAFCFVTDCGGHHTKSIVIYNAAEFNFQQKMFVFMSKNVFFEPDKKSENTK
jgi:hypothetical protein